MNSVGLLSGAPKASTAGPVLGRGASDLVVGTPELATPPSTGPKTSSKETGAVDGNDSSVGGAPSAV